MSPLHYIDSMYIDRLHRADIVLKGKGTFALLACLTTLEGAQSQSADEADAAGPPSSCPPGEISVKGKLTCLR